MSASLQFPSFLDVMSYVSRHLEVNKKQIGHKEAQIILTVSNFFSGKPATNAGIELGTMWKVWDLRVHEKLLLDKSFDQIDEIVINLAAALKDCAAKIPL